MWEHGTRGVSPSYFPALAAALDLDEHQIVNLVRTGPRARLDGTRLPGLAASRRAAGLTGRALATRVGVAASTLSMWETAGVPVPRDTVQRLADELACPVTTLIDAQSAAIDERPLRRYRREAGMTRQEAASLLSINVGTLARYEAGLRRVPIPVLRRMALMYRQPTGDLLQIHGQLPRLPARPWGEADFSAVIHAARLHAGLTKVDLGRLVRRSGQAVRNWETGQVYPPGEARRRLELVLRLPPGSLL